MNVFQIHPELGEEWFRTSSTMMLISGPDGTVHDANPEFLQWIGYNHSELTRKDNPITWTHFTVPGEDLEADKSEAERCVKGLTSSYNARKHYVPKGGLPRLVNIHATRYPVRGDETNFEFFIVEVYPLGSIHQEAFDEIAKLQRLTTKHLSGISEAVKTVAEKVPPAEQVFTFLKANPKIAVPVILILMSLLFGRSVLEIIEQAMTTFWGKS